MIGHGVTPTSTNGEPKTPIPLVSVIIPFNNEEAFLQEAIDSVRVQKHTNWELFLVDDGSTDDSTSIAKNASTEDPDRIRYLEHPGHCNRGPGPSRNLGLEHASGEFIAFLDGDDLWFRDKLSRQVAMLLHQPDVDMICARSLFWHFPMEECGAYLLDFVHDMGLPDAVLEPPVLLTNLLRNEDFHPTICGLLVRRQLYETFGGFDERIAYVWEDTAFLAKVFLHSRVALSSDCVAAYRLHKNSSCHTCANVDVLRADFLRWLSQYLNEQGIAHTEIWRVLRMKLFRCRHARLYGAAQPLKPLFKWGRRQLSRVRTVVGAQKFGSARTFVDSEQGGGAETAKALCELAAVYRSTGRAPQAIQIEEVAQRVALNYNAHTSLP
jgi:glycosyltransferase involved in cell wall biosynthesis